MKLDFNLDKKNLATGVSAAAVALALFAFNLHPALLEWVTDEEKLDRLLQFITGFGAIVTTALALLSGNLPKEDA